MHLSPFIFVLVTACGGRAPAPAPTSPPTPVTQATKEAKEECQTDEQCPATYTCQCPAAGVAGRDGGVLCAGPYACYPPGSAPLARP